MDGCAFAIFDTPIGRCALVWRTERVTGAALPERSDADMRHRIERRFPGAVETIPRDSIGSAVEAVRRLLSGEAEDFAAIPLDLDRLAPFERKVLAFTRTIPTGETRTYGGIADAIGEPGAARAVGRALGRNPIPIIIPCHRVLSASGTGGFSAPGGVTTKFRILEIERARRSAAPGLFDHLPLAISPRRSPIGPPNRAR